MEVKKILDKFIKIYGREKGLTVYKKWKKENPKHINQAVKTARKKGDKFVKLPTR